MINHYVRLNLKTSMFNIILILRRFYFSAKAQMSEGKKINHKALIDEMAGHLDHFNADTFQAKDLERLINQVIIPLNDDSL